MPDFSICATTPRSGVPVLLYHRIVDDHLYPSIPPPESIFSMPVSRFAQQMDALAASGYRALNLSEFEQVINGSARAPGRAVLITFDDGCESVFRLAAPHLGRHRMPAVVFVTTDGGAGVFHQPYSQRQLTPDEMLGLERQGVSCESHGVTHCGLGDLSEKELQEELAGSRQRLTALLKRDVRALALPLNSHSRAVFEAARRCGYRLVFTSDPGFCRGGDDPITLKRIIVEGGISTDEFARLLRGRGLAVRRLLAGLKRIPPRILGYRRWMPIRRRLFSSSAGCLLTPGSLRRGILVAAVLAAAAGIGGAALALLRLLRPQ